MKEIIGSFYFLDDKLISSKDFNLQFLAKGINVYEVLRYINTAPIFFEEHFERLMISSEGNQLCHKIDRNSLLKNIQELLRANADGLGNIKIVLHSEKNKSCKLYIYQTPHHYPSAEDYIIGVKAVSLIEGRPDPNLKTWRPVFKELVFNLKKKYNAYEIFLIEDGKIREGSQSNFFALYENRIITAPGKKVLKGITREIVFQICREQNIKIEEVDFSLKELQNAQAIFLTGTSPGILPISQLDDLNFSPTHPFLKILLEKYNEIIQNHIKKLQ